ncbi:hypothetical protein [Dysosmobacter sp.]|uniref:hypothetical protein n=1 Tax=Dysosmobacter sp. TaxID=2591382 RepID=UPI003FD7AE50|nr:hypothetical protein [Oscillibacter sp.]
MSIQRHYNLGRGDLDNNWIVENLTNAFGVWTNKMTEMWSLLTESPQTFKGGTIWQTTEQLTNRDLLIRITL